MPFSSGSFSLYSVGNPVVTGTTISSSWANNTLSDIATGLTTCILKDGTQTITANIPWGGYKITGLGAGSARTDAASLATIQDGTGVYVGTVGGTADAITLTPAPAITAYVAGQQFWWIASGANTGAVTIQVSGIAGPKNAKKNGTTALAAGDIPSGALIGATYDGTNFQISTVGLSTFAASSLLTAAGYTFVASAASTPAGLAPTADVAAHATTSNIWGAREIILTGGAVTFTDVADAPYAGAVSWVKQNAAHSWTNGGNFTIQGAADYTAVAGDWIRVYATTTSAFEITVFRLNGASVGGANVQTFNVSATATGIWTKPTGFSPNAVVIIEGWGGGGSGGKGAANAPEGGGGGGAYVRRQLLLSDMGSTETVTLGQGGAAQTSASTAGNAGGNTTVGSLLTAYGGGGGGANAAGGGGGGGGGMLGAGATASGQNGGAGGGPTAGASLADMELQGTGGLAASTTSARGGPNTDGGGGGGASGAAANGRGGDSSMGGGGGGAGIDGAGTAANNRGGNSVWGGGGGGGAANSVEGGSAGTSIYGGSGSAGAIDANASSAGTIPGGGSGGTEGGDSGIGGHGRAIITVIAGG